MRYILTGFTPDLEFRVFAFQRVLDDHTRSDFTVKADLSLIRKYAIRIQELPLLCRAVLERNEDTDAASDLTFTEQDMRDHHRDALAAQAAADKRKPHRRPPSPNAGTNWRTPPARSTANSA